MGEDRSALEKIERLPVLIVAGTRLLAKELADGHGYDQGEWVYVDTAGKLKTMKAEQIAFGRGAEKLVEIGDIVKVSIARKYEVIFGSYPGVSASAHAELVEAVAPLIQSPEPTLPPPEEAGKDVKPSVRPGDKRFKANRVPGAKTAAQAIRVKFLVANDALGKYRFVTPAAEVTGQFDHANTLEEIVEKVKIAYAPRVFLEEIEE